MLTRILKGTDVQFTLQGKHIILSDRPNRPEARTGVRGKVVGAKDSPSAAPASSSPRATAAT